MMRRTFSSVDEFLDMMSGDMMGKKIIPNKLVRHEGTQLESDAAGNVTATSGSGTGLSMTERDALRFQDLLHHLIEWGDEL